MNYLSTMTEDEISYICSVIPLRESIAYFKQYPKDFAKIMPGFRATSLKNQEQISGILFRNRTQRFISSFIEKHIGRWIDEISMTIKSKIEEGHNRESALLQTLPHCFFADNIGLYFKLVDEKHSEEYLSLLDTSIVSVKDTIKEREELEAMLKTQAAATDKLKSALQKAQEKQSIQGQKLRESIDEIKTLKRTIIEHEKDKGVIAAHEQTILTLQLKKQELEEYVHQLNSELSSAKSKQLHLEQKIRVEIEKQQEIEKFRTSSAQKPKCPIDLDEFRDYLGYNLENLGVPTDADYYSLLKNHLSIILFQGKPIIISRSPGFSLMKCISNTLVGSSAVSVLSFSSDITEKAIDSFFSQTNRVICLDNFIGNYNETMLITLCDQHRDKIIFLTVAYDHTLTYVPEELMRYCHYLNLNRIEAFIGERELTEDPSVVAECEAGAPSAVADARWSNFLKDMLGELGAHGATPSYMVHLVVNELSLCGWLAFDILPYCTDVLKIAPFGCSARLVKYAGTNGRCPYKDVFWRWFS